MALLLCPAVKIFDVPKCLARLDNLARFVKASTERNLYRFKNDPDFGHSEPMWRMALLVTNIKLDFGPAYDPIVQSDLQRGGHSPFTDFPQRVHFMGCCRMIQNVPALGKLLVRFRRWSRQWARRLGYPVRLAA